MELNKQTIKKIILILFAAITFHYALHNFAAVTGLFQYLVQVFWPFLIGGAMAFILNIPMSRIERQLIPFFEQKPKLKGLCRPLAFLITLILAFGIVTLVVFVVVPEIGRTLLLLAEQIPNALTSLENTLNALAAAWPDIELYLSQLDIDWAELSRKAVTTFQSLASAVINSGFNAVGGVVSAVSTLFSAIATFVISFIFSIYLLMQKEKLACQGKQVIYGLFSEPRADKIAEVLAMSQVTFSKFFSGQCLEAVILGALFFLSMTVLRFPYALLVGVLIAVTALIPIVGAFIGCFVGVFLILIVDPVQALQFILLFLVLQQIEGNLIYPKVVGNSVGLPAIWVLTAVTVGGNLMGVVGMLIFIPLCSVCYALFRTFIKDRLKQRKVPASKWEKPVQLKK